MSNFELVGDFSAPSKFEYFRTMGREFFSLRSRLEAATDGFLTAILREDPRPKYIIRALERDGEAYNLRELVFEVAGFKDKRTADVVFSEGFGPVGGTMTHSDQQVLGENMSPQEVFREILTAAAVLAGERELKPILAHYGLRVKGESATPRSLPDFEAVQELSLI